MAFVNAAVCFAQAFSQCVFFFGGVVLEQNKVDSARICRKTPYKSQSTLPWNLTYSHLTKKSMLESRLYPWLHLFGGWGLEAWTSGTRLPAISAHPGRQWFQFPLRKTHWTFDRSTSVDFCTPHDGQKKGKETHDPIPPKKRGENEDPILVILGEGIYTPQIAPPTFHQRKIQNEGFMLKCCWFLLASKLADCIWFTVLCLMVSNRCFLVILRWLGRWWSGIPFQYLPHVHIKIVLGVPKSFNIFHKI